MFSSRVPGPESANEQNIYPGRGTRDAGRLFVIVFEIAPEAPLIFHIEHDARVDRTRVDVQADRALVPFRQILDAVDRLFLVDGVQRTAGNAELGGELLHLDFRRAGEAVHADDLLVLRPVAVDLAVVLDDQLAFEHRHPAELAVVGVERRGRADRPADEHHFDHVVAKDLVAGVPVGHPQLVGFEVVRAHLVRQQEVVHPLFGDHALRELLQAIDELSDRDRLGRADCTHARILCSRCADGGQAFRCAQLLPPVDALFSVHVIHLM